MGLDKAIEVLGKLLRDTVDGELKTALEIAICHLTAAAMKDAAMNWITEHDITIIDINYDTKACYVEHNGRRYGCSLRQHNGDWYFSLDDRCVWYIVKDMMGIEE